MPGSDALSAVNAWLQEHGLTSKPLTAAGDWIQVMMNVSQANTLLAADFSMFSHSDSGMETLRTLSYSIPSALKGHIDLIHPTTVYVSSTQSVPQPNEPSLQFPRSRQDYQSGQQEAGVPQRRGFPCFYV